MLITGSPFRASTLICTAAGAGPVALKNPLRKANLQHPSVRARPQSPFFTSRIVHNLTDLVEDHRCAVFAVVIDMGNQIVEGGASINTSVLEVRGKRPHFNGVQNVGA